MPTNVQAVPVWVPGGGGGGGEEGQVTVSDIKIFLILPCVRHTYCILLTLI